MKKNVYEIFEEFKAAENETEKRQVLVKNATPDFVAFLQCAFDPRVKFVKFEHPKMIFEGRPKKGEFKADMIPPGMGYTNMANAIKKTYLFIEGHPRRGPLTEEKMQQLLSGILEGLEAREADMYLNMLNKSVKVPGLTPKLLEKTFIGFFTEPIRL